MVDTVAPRLAAPHQILAFERLSDEQRVIVERLNGPLLALAPAGTGKTTVLTERVARALEAGIPPERILCVTFTNRAARELRARILARFPRLASRLMPRTFHQLCADILRREAKRVGLMVDFAVCDESTSIDMLRRILNAPEGEDDEARSVYQRLQDVKIDWPTRDLRWPLGAAWARAGFEKSRHQDAARRYERGLSQWHRLDFADLVLYVRAIVAARPDIREHWSHRFDLVQVDEIQDTHLSEYEVVALLASGSGNLALFGDLDQTIYEWRGATPQQVMRRFRADFGTPAGGDAASNGVLITSLTDNHRATRVLIRAADTFAASLTRRETRLSPAASCPEGEPIQELIAESVSGEATWIAERVAALHQRDGVPLPSIGILAPANWYCEEISRALTRGDVPHLTAARVAFFRRPEIVDALSYLRLLLNPGSAGDALRVWERSTRDVDPRVLGRIVREGGPAGLRLVDFFKVETFEAGDPHAALLDAYDHGRIVIFDLETTGLDDQRDEIVELAVMRLKAGRPDGRYASLVRPSIPVGDSEDVHHLSDEVLARDGKPPAEVLERFVRGSEGAMLVGHNIRHFDLRVVAAQAARHGLSFSSPATADTYELIQRFRDQGPYTLAALAEGLRLPHLPDHRAASDVATTADLLAWIVERARQGTEQRRRLVEECGPAFEGLASRVQAWRALVPVTRPPALLSHVLEESGQWERIAHEPARRAALHQLVATFEEEDDPAQPPAAALRAAIERAVLATQVDLLASAEQRVPVLTIHQAKGLEFDVVFVAGCSDGDLPRRRSAANRLDEERRLFYVALTRARRTLILSRAAYSDGGRPKAPSPFLRLLGDHLVPAAD